MAALEPTEDIMPMSQERSSLEASAKPAPRKRRRIVISCTECHRRKQKCDRKEPCTNCISRNKESACHYETSAPSAKASRKSTTTTTATISSSSSSPRNTHNGILAAEIMSDAAKTTVDLGYSTNAASTLGILRRIEGAGDEPLAGMPAEHQHDIVNVETRERYKSLVRQLPPRTHLEKLIEVYFRDINWQYGAIDEPILRLLLSRWYSIPYNVLQSSGPQALDPTLRALPALLFQMIALGILYLRQETAHTYECLKFTDNMSFDDLAAEYSETGMAVLSLLGKRQMSIVTVLAGWARAFLLKSTGGVTDAWHQVGTSIRDAQGIGLDRDTMDPLPAPDDTGDEAMEKMRMTQQRRAAWLILVSWDLHTGAVLGRPTSIDHRMVNRAPPIDAALPKNPNRLEPLIQRTSDDPPTPLARTICGWEIMKSLRDILDLEKEGPFPTDFTKVDRLQDQIIQARTRVPASLRHENPDTRFDNLPDYWWVEPARAQLTQLSAFNVVALHRPYVFTRYESRHEALKSSLEMLEAQRRQFEVLNISQHRTYSLFFGTFDAVVMVASIYILFPREHPDLLDETRQHFQWAVERFEVLAERNRLANSALGVLRAIWIRFKKTVGLGSLICNGSCNRTAETEAAERWLESASQKHEANSASSPSTLPSPATDRNTSASSVTTRPTPPSIMSDHPTYASADWASNLPPDFDFSTIMPMYPIGDIAYNDLNGVLGGPSRGIPDGPTAAASWAGAASSYPMPPEPGTSTLGMPGLHTMPAHQEEVPWQFGGEFGTDTIWNLLNQFPAS
ncbi:hypothetical protein F5Y16DRAFT_369940 [Xylariaceae sp. FL0255]|nr:hypothetical protein F5Y16DRAFT_369940 [Xylariaceae sp. FL0255]